MKQFIKYTYILSILLVVSFVLIGCGALEKDQPESKFDPFYDDPNYYMPGDSIAGGDFTFLSVTVDAYIWDESKGEFIHLEDGSYVPPGTYRLGIHPSMRREPNMLEMDIETLNDLAMGQPMDQRVYASDGGNEYLVEAFYNEESELYECDFKVDGKYTTFTLLLEVLYPDHMAKKEKVTLNTVENLRASPDKVVKEGMGLAINMDSMIDLMPVMLEKALEQPDVLKILISAMGDMLCMDLSAVTDRIDTMDKEKIMGMVDTLLNMVEITPGDNSLMDISMLGGAVTMGMDIPDTYEDGDELEGGIVVDMPITVGPWQSDEWVTKIVNNLMTKLLPIMQDPISMNLDAIAMPMMDQMIDVMLSTVDLNEFMEEGARDLIYGIFPMNITMIAHMFSRPEENTDNLAMMYMTGFLADSTILQTQDQMVLAGRCFPPWPDGVTMDATPALDVAPIKRNDATMGIAMSQYMLNSSAGQIGGLMALKIPESYANMIKTMIQTENASADQQMAMIFNPNGITFQLLDSKDSFEAIVIINDTIMQITDNGAPLSIWNFDMGIKMGASFSFDGGDLCLNLKITIIPDMMRLHIVDDTMGMTFIDHSSVMKSIADMLIAQEVKVGIVTEREIPLNLTDLAGIKVKKEGTSISSTQDGNCYMNMALDGENPIDLSKMKDMISGCFISNLQF